MDDDVEMTDREAREGRDDGGEERPPLADFLPLVIAVYTVFCAAACVGQVAYAVALSSQTIFRPIPKRHGYVEMCLTEFSEATFRTRFRMSKMAFLALCRLVGPHMFPRPRLDVDTVTYDAVGCCIQRLATQTTTHSLADKFGLADGSVSDYLWSFCRIVNTHLVPDLISWPSRDEMAEISERFARHYALFPGVIGAVDGTLVPLVWVYHQTRPDYICRKGFPALNTLAVCDDRLCFRFVSTGWAGSNGDSHIDGMTLRSQRNTLVPGRFVLLGDNGFGNSDKLLVPYKGNWDSFSGPQKRFNWCHTRTRVAIEMAFGRWKGIFQSMKRSPFNPLYTSHAILTTMALHNMIQRYDGGEDDDLDEDEDDEDNTMTTVPDTAQGETARARIADHLFAGYMGAPIYR